jgi:hypothetical protein
LLQSSSASSPDSDPLLCFETEHEAKPESPEPVVETRTSTDQSEALAPPNPLTDRVGILEKALAASNAEVALLRSDVATLVRAVDDIRTRSRKPAAGVVQAHSNARRTASVIAGLVVAVVVGGWLWMSNRASAEPMVPAAPVEDSAVPTVPASTPAPPAPAVPTPTRETAAPPQAAPATTPPKQSAPATKPSEGRASASPVAYVGTLSIDAEPDGDVFIDRRSAGRTPLHVANLKAGSHLVWIEREGYQRFTRVVQVPADRVSRVWADLESLTAR